jgi:hypothetical protein
MVMGKKVKTNCPSCVELQQENTRLKNLLATHNIPWAEETAPPPLSPTEKPAHQLSSEEKIALFRRLFRGRSDVYPVRWESAKGGAGYSPACKNEWRPGVCGKPRIKCGACKQRQFLPVTDRVVYNHLAGQHTIGGYPLLKDDRCYFLATDFDESSCRTMHWHLYRAAKNWRFRQLWKFRAQDMGHTSGSFFLMLFQQPKLEG